MIGGSLFLPENRFRRNEVAPPRSVGLYALFLAQRGTLSGLALDAGTLLYIGKAENARGLHGRCHFNGKTASHSPRRSLAALLMDDLHLTPVPVLRSDGSYKRFGLTAESEKKLDAWMLKNVKIAYETCESPGADEKRLIAKHQPPLNLTDCPASPASRLVTAARREVDRRLQA